MGDHPVRVGDPRPAWSAQPDALLILVATLALVMTGAGALSIDHARGHRIHERMEVPW